MSDDVLHPGDHVKRIGHTKADETDVYADLCEPGNHHEQCAPTNARCPHR